MRKRSSIYNCSGSRDGVALVMVLAFVVLLTILVISFIAFTKQNRVATASYSKSIQAEEIAEGGLQDILFDLHQEIVAGSTVYNTNSSGVTYSNTTPTIYVPTTNFTASPARLGYPAGYWGTDLPTSSTGANSLLGPTLIRVSRADPTGNLTNLYPVLNSGYFSNLSALPNGAILNRASSANTGNTSANGRTISFTRWNKPCLVAYKTYNPNGSQFVSSIFATNLPDWVYVTRTGSHAYQNSDVTSGGLLPNTSLTHTNTVGSANGLAGPVVGRYAFVMYDEGALLDVNAAGTVSTAIGGTSPASPPTTYNAANAQPSYTDTNTLISITIPGKSFITGADLTQLGWSQANIDNFINWRNASAASSGSISGTNYLKTVFTNGQNGFLTFQTSGTGTDSPILGRQDLINYFYKLANGSTATTLKPLGWLGTFSRDFSAPSYFPPLDSSSMTNYVSGWSSPVTYHTSMESPSAINRDLANVRYAAAGTVTHYNDNLSSSPMTYAVAIGDPLLQKRFSLARIGWLSSTAIGGTDTGGVNPANANTTAPSTAGTAAIHAGFGLIWDYAGGVSLTVANGGNKCWTYVGSTLSSPGVFTATSSSSPASSIETLAQVASESVPREPNFFELLKAAILSGSLGLDPGSAAYLNGADNSGNPSYNPGGGGVNHTVDDLGNTSVYSHTMGSGTTARAPAQISDLQIMKIGADIIDQYDADSYPTAIYFRYMTSGTELAFDPVTGGSANPGLYGPVDMVYGDENLPELNAIESTWCSTAGNGTSGATNGPYYPPYTYFPNTNNILGFLDYSQVTAMGGFYQPQIWNPHQQPATALTNIPQNYQIRAYGSALTFWGMQGKGYGWTNRATATGLTSISGQSSVVNYFQGSGSTESSPNGTLNFTDTNSGGASSFYAYPYNLSQDQIPGVTANSPGANNMATNFITGGTYPPYWVKNHFVAFNTGISTGFYGDWSFNATNSTYHEVPVNGSVDIEPSPAPTTFVLGWLDGGGIGAGNFHPYSFITGAFTFSYNTIGSGGFINNYVGSCQPDDVAPYSWGNVDSRTSRFGTTSSVFGLAASGSTNYQGTTLFASNNNRKGPNAYMPDNTGFRPIPTPANPNGNPTDWAINTIATNSTAGQTVAPYNYYADPDGVVRPGDGAYGSQTTGDGMLLYTSAGAGTGGKASGDTTANTSTYPGTSIVTNASGNTFHGRRPLILNRPFRNVGELGYVFRDLPFKTLDFFSPNSADAALLDVFSLTDETPIVNGRVNSVVAGRVNLNNAPLEVISALLSMGSKKDFDPNYYINSPVLSTTETSTIITAIVNTLNPSTGSGPLLNRAGIVTQLGSIIQPKLSSTADMANKAYLEGSLRALSNVTTERTWTVMIDVIAQSGHMSPTAKSLNDFVVEGEKRYWLHISIDRYTGRIIDQQLETVYE